MVIKLIDYIIYDLMKLDPSSHITGSIHFFLYDTLKIIIILSVMIFLISMIRSFFPAEKVKETLNKFHSSVAYVIAACLGVVSPFCSCSTVPVFIGFVESGIPLGVTFTFLITSPIVNEIAIGFLFLTFGLKIAVIYTLAGMFIGIVSGVLISKLHLEHLVEEYIYEMQAQENFIPKRNFRDRIDFSISQVKDIVGRVWKFVIFGVSLGALIHGFVPSNFLADYAGPNNPLAVFVAVAAGIPMYSNAVGVIPIIEALISKGVGVGTGLAFMMSVVALSLPEMILLKQVIKPKLIAIFVAITGTSILMVGYLFNYIL
ncbi:permease [Clostridiaceae bacterium HSG29]|nr:permease [Clostridiaceae bacterium HSG29]